MHKRGSRILSWVGAQRICHPRSASISFSSQSKFLWRPTPLNWQILWGARGSGWALTAQIFIAICSQKLYKPFTNHQVAYYSVIHRFNIGSKYKKGNERIFYFKDIKWRWGTIFGGELGWGWGDMGRVHVHLCEIFFNSIQEIFVWQLSGFGLNTGWRVAEKMGDDANPSQRTNLKNFRF